ncbi:MAG: AAA family ATPase [Methanomethylophilus alvi]
MNGEVSRKYIPIGVDDFKEIRDGNYYFVDKSELISDILDSKAKVHLFTRPRRFGKSLNLSMLDAFFNLRYEGNTWFDGLKVSGHKETEVHKNAYPVIYLNMKELSVGSYNDFIQDLNLCISRLFQRYEIEGNSCPTSPENMDIYARGRAQKLNESEIRQSVSILCRILQDIYGVAPIVLIDEYDNPINNAFDKKDYDRILDFLRNFYSATFKSNECLNFAVMTGVMQITTGTVFSGLNNLKVNNIFTKKSDERYGFTDPEVQDLCAYYGHSEKYMEAKEWYDGYRFGKAEVYNPWSLLNYVDEGFDPDTYWAETSGNDIIDTLLKNTNLETYGELQALAEGKIVRKTLSLNISLRDLDSDRNAVFSVMAIAGYLNAVPLGDDGYGLSIPNTEMRKVFSSMMLRSIHSDASLAFKFFFEGMIESDPDKMKDGMDTILRDNIPFILLTDEKDYQLIIAAAAMSLLGRYSVKLEKESGNGRADIIMAPNRPGIPNIVFELKKTRAITAEGMKKSADEALCQIKERRYFSGMEGRTLLYGICFRGKESAISMEETFL